MRTRFHAILTLMLIPAAIISCRSQYHTQSLKFEEGMSEQEKVAQAAMVIPSQKQLRWQSLELTAFLHFGMNTFTGNEWGDGTDSPEMFLPTDLDCRQWVRTLKDAGFKMAILTAKHHDGFCLWQTETTEPADG